MKRACIVLLMVLNSVSATFSLAQNNATQSTSSAKELAIFLSPKNADLYVPARTTLIVRVSKNILAGVAASDFSFTVRGEVSGIHTGRVVIADDERTSIFKPDVPFVLNELVHVKLTIAGGENIPPIRYSFRITEMTDAERAQVLNEIQQKERGEKITSAQTALTKNDDQQAQCITSDSLPIKITVDSLTNPSEGNVFFSAANLFNGSYSFIGILNNSGVPAFYQNIPRGCENFKVLPDNTLSYFEQTSFPQSGLISGEIDRMDINGRMIDTYKCGNGYTTDYHDFQLLPNGHALLVSFDPEYVDMTKVISDSGAKTHAKVTGAIIQEIDQYKNVVFQWRSWDHLSITDATHESFTSSFIDYVHINTAAFDTDGNIIASFRHMDEVTKISRTDTTTIWRWGGKHNQFTFLGDTLKFCHQHNPTRIANGHVTLWDNGNFRFVDTIINGKDTLVNRPFTRAVEFDLDENLHTATAVWQYRNLPFSAAGGNVQRLSNGNTFIGLGIQTNPGMIEINPNGEKVFQVSLEFGAWCYRAYKFPLMMNGVPKTAGKNSLEISSIYPNPAQNTTTISCYTGIGPVVISLTDVLGHTALSLKQPVLQTGVNTFNLNVRDLPVGAYSCKLSQAGAVISKTIIIQK
jgi:hypothetical protein